MTKITSGTRPQRAAPALLAALGVLLLLAGAAHVTLGLYDPDLDAAAQEIASPGSVQVLPVEGRSVAQIEYLDREELRIELEVHNAGRLPVTVTDAAPVGRDDAHRLMQPFAVAVPDGTVTATSRLGGSSVRIPGHETRRVVVRARFVDCEFISSRSSSLLSGVELRYRVLWRTGHLDLDLPTQYRASSPRDSDCPRSTLESRPPG